MCTLPGEDRTFYSAKFSPYGNHLVTTATGANNAPLAEVWDAETGRKLLELDLQGARTFDAAYTHDGTRIVTVNRKTGLAVWNADSGKLVRTLDCPMEVHNLLLSPDGQRCLATWGPGRSFGKIQGASLWNIQTGKELLRIAEQAESLVGFSADGTTILGLDEPDGSSGTVWSSETGGVVRSIKLQTNDWQALPTRT